MSCGACGFSAIGNSGAVSSAVSRPAAATAWRLAAAEYPTASTAVGMVTATSVEPSTSIGVTQPLRMNHRPPARFTSSTTGASTNTDDTARSRTMGPTNPAKPSLNSSAASANRLCALPVSPNVLTTETPAMNSTMVALIWAMPSFICAMRAIAPRIRTP
ncbi:Uncharacterised protein [Mycobacteroides abscessus subsp. abscessus]|nr:Uncharacterised protein [Mycobacteroides abscessus subsp. abscessus]